MWWTQLLAPTKLLQHPQFRQLFGTAADVETANAKVTIGKRNLEIQVACCTAPLRPDWASWASRPAGASQSLRPLPPTQLQLKAL